MAVKQKKTGAVLTRAEKGIAGRDELPLGPLQARILKKVDDLGDEAFGYKVLEELMLDTRAWIDPSQVYGSFRKMLAEDKKYIEQVASRVVSRGPPAKVYRVTPAGRAVLKATVTYLRALANYLDGEKAQPSRR